MLTLKLTDEARRWLEPMKADLQKYFLANLRGMNDDQMFLLIERDFGHRLVKEICLPHSKLNLGGCVEIAMLIAKEAPMPIVDSQRGSYSHQLPR